MSIILQALAKNQDRLIPNNPTRIQTEGPLPAARPRAVRRHSLPDVSPIWDDTQSRAQAAAQAVQPSVMVAPRGLSEIKISWVLIVVAMGCMFGMLAAFYPPSRVEARTAPAAALPVAEAAAAPALEAPAAETSAAFAEDLQVAAVAPAEPIVLSAVISDQPQAAPAAEGPSSVVRVVFRKEGGQTEPDGTYRQEYAAPLATQPQEIAEPANHDEPLEIPGLVPVQPAGAGSVPEIAYEDDTLYEAAPIPTATKDAPEAAKPKFKSKTRSASSAPAQAEPAAMRVEGIFWDRSRPMALINGDIVEIGSRVRDGQVVDIQPSSVTIDVKGVKTVMTP